MADNFGLKISLEGEKEFKCNDFAIHDKQDGNHNVHIMLTIRPLEQSGEWGAKSKKEYLLDKDGQRIKLKNGTFKSRKVDTVDWNSQEKAEVWCRRGRRLQTAVLRYKRRDMEL